MPATAHRALQSTGTKTTLLFASLSPQVRALRALGKIDEARQLLTKGDTLLQDLTVEDQAPAAVWIPVFKLTKMGELQGRTEALAYASLSQLLADFEKFNTPSHLAETVFWIGRVFYLKGEYDTALEYYQRSLVQYEKLEHNAGIAYISLHMGFIFGYKGEVDKEFNYHQRSLTFVEASGVPKSIAAALRYVGVAHHRKSEFDTALGYFQQSLALAESIDDKSGIGDAALMLGRAYYTKGELNRALEYYRRSLTLITIFQDDQEIAVVLTSLIQVALARQDRVQAQAHLTDLQTIAMRNPDNKHTQFRSRLMEALVSKQSPRMADKGQAQTLLKQLMTEEHFGWHWELTMEGLLHLCDLLIFETRATGESEAWEEAKAILDQFYTLAQDAKSKRYMPEALLLQAKFAQIDGDLQQAQTYLNEAKMIATELDSGLLVVRVETEQTQLATDFEKWHDLIRRNATLQERLTEARLAEYLQKAQDTLTHLS